MQNSKFTIEKVEDISIKDVGTIHELSLPRVLSYGYLISPDV
jgi:hypothetical protein